MFINKKRFPLEHASKDPGTVKETGDLIATIESKARTDKDFSVIVVTNDQFTLTIEREHSLVAELAIFGATIVIDLKFKHISPLVVWATRYHNSRKLGEMYITEQMVYEYMSFPRKQGGFPNVR